LIIKTVTNLKKFLKILQWFIVSILLLIIMLWFALKIPAVQNFVAQKVVTRLSQELKTKVTVKRVNFSLFNFMNIEGLYIEDLQKDTLLYAGVAQVKITDWFFLKDKAQLSYIALSDVKAKTYRKDSVWNYQFIADLFKSNPNSTNKKKGIELDLKYILLNNLHLNQKDEWLGQNQEITLKKLELNANDINFNKQNIDIASLIIKDPIYSNSAYARLKKPNPIVTADTTGVTKHWKLFGWNIAIGSIDIENGTVQNDKATNRPQYEYFDGQHLLFSKINMKAKNVKWNTDTVTFTTDITAVERSGLEIKKFTSAIKAYPNTIVFNKLLLETPNSTIQNAIAFSFDDFNTDISDFINKININANLVNTNISNKDLILFAPKLKELNKDYFIEGKIRGTVANFKSQNLLIKTGNTIVKGNLNITGLPNIKETFIDFSKGNIQTNYDDITSLVPSLKKVKGVSLNKLGQINYDGSFTGFINDFVTYGTLKTNLGTVITDLNMKLPEGGIPNYSGKVATTSFELGRLLNNSKIGTIGFNGKMKGEGFTLNTIKTDIDGTLSKLDYGTYTYQDISVNGRVENKRFKGIIDAKDANLIAKLDGTVDFNGNSPLFDIKANIDRAHFKKLQFTKEDFSLTGKVGLNFKGSNIDDFDGTIKLDGATLSKDGKALPFDYITLQSLKTPQGRHLLFNSTEFEGYVKGNFSYKNIVNAFSLFLYQYYPSVFAKPKSFDQNQNFEFEITTKNVDEYTKLIRKDLLGFNDAHIKGRINSITKDAAFDAEIPYFGLQDYKFNNLVLNGIGSTDSLTVKGNVGKLIYKDSLEFDNTVLNINTINNQSTFSLQSSSDNGTLNELDVNGNILVYNDGVQVNFEPSSFTVNGQKWLLEKNGEVILRKNVIYAENMKFVNGDQEIVIRNELGKDDESQSLVADVKNVEIGDFTQLFIKTNKFSGKLNGQISVKDPTGKPTISTDETSITNFVKDGEPIGKLDINAGYNIATKKVTYTVNSKENKNYKFNVDGSYDPSDTTGTTIRNKINLQGTNVKVIANYLSGVFKDIDGTVKGDVEIFGSAKKQFILGNVEIDDTLSMTVKYTNVPYKVPKGSIVFNARDIDFSGLKIQDSLQNKGLVKRGKIEHDGFFKEMDFDIVVESEKMLLLNTNRNLNPTFYGYAIGDAKMKLKGRLENLKMDITANNPADAKLVLVTGAQGRTLGKADFIDFKTYGREMGSNKKIATGNIDITMRITATPKIQMQVILDELAGDNIVARGDGNIVLGIATGGDISLNGSYTVQEGSYSFNLRTWIPKPFKIEKGSTISWSGDPYKADIGINAIYKTQSKVSLSDLFTNINSSAPKTSFLEVTAKLEGNLLKPDIKFGIRYPSTETKDPQIENLLELIRKDESELNKQVAFLVLFDKLLPYRNNNNNAGFNPTDAAINTISGLLTSEITKEINKLFREQFKTENIEANFDLKTYSPNGLLSTQTGNFAERLSSNFGLTFNLFDKRLLLVVNGNFDVGLLKESTLKLLPNFQIEYKIRPDGGIVATIFHRQNLDPLQADADKNRRLSSGLGIAWRRESDNFWNVFGFRKRKIK
jgi:hypothetical protein